jgi:hypothetical protein
LRVGLWIGTILREYIGILSRREVLEVLEGEEKLLHFRHLVLVEEAALLVLVEE